MSDQGRLVDLYYDDREPGNIPRKVEKLGWKTESSHLECSDYIVRDLLIERKTYSDLWSALQTRRIWDQLHHIKLYNEENSTKAIVGLIGSPYEIIKRIGVDRHDNVYAQLIGFMLTSFQSYDIPTIQFDNDDQFVKMIDLQIKKGGKPTSYKPIGFKKKDMTNLESVKSDSLCAIPGIGRPIGDYLAKNFRIIDLINLPDENLKEITVNGRKIGNKALNIKKAYTT